MDIFEAAVLEYLTHEGKVFVCPQFRGEGYFADFVAINLEDDALGLEIIEVNSGAYKPNSLIKKLKWYQENEKRITDSLMNRLPQLKGLIENKPITIRVFIQHNFVPCFGELKDGLENVKVHSLEKVFETLLDWRQRTLASEDP
jgi:hypothetical protein